MVFRTIFAALYMLFSYITICILTLGFYFTGLVDQEKYKRAIEEEENLGNKHFAIG